MFSRHLLPLLQLTRMALVFTAIADSLCTLLLRAERNRLREQGASVWEYLDPKSAAAVVVMSIGLYGFGMSLNDIIDRRRDRQMAAHRPLPSGQIGVAAAHIICVLLGLAAIIAGGLYARWSEAGWMSIVLVIWTGLLIAFYDVAGKYLVAPGLLSLGLIRFFHAVIPAPQLPLLWHPLLLLNHVTILSAVAYQWEEKRPALTKLHWWAVLGGLGLIDGMAIGLVWWRRHGLPPGRGLWISPGLVFPLAAAVGFVMLAFWIRRRVQPLRQAGQALMLYGLLWLIIYDAAFLAGYVGPLSAILLILLLPVAYLSVQLMRGWSKFRALSQRPAFKRAEN